MAMEFVERVLGIQRRKREKLIAERMRLISNLGIRGETGEELVGPDYEETTVVRIGNDQFKQLLHERRPSELLRELVHASDTHKAYALYMGIGEGVKVKTDTTEIDYSPEKTLLDDLYEIGYRSSLLKPASPSDSRSWTAYRLEEVNKSESGQDTKREN